MNEIINMEVRFFLMSVLWGAILLIIYDCLRILRKVIAHNVVWISVEDIIYWAISAVLIFRMMYQMNDGVIRGFSILGILLGMIIYKYSISDYVVRGISFVLNKIKQFVEKVIRILLKPLKFLLGKLKKLIVAIGKFVKKKLGLFAHFLHRETNNQWKALKSKVKRGRMSKNDSAKQKKVKKSKRSQKKERKRKLQKA